MTTNFNILNDYKYLSSFDLKNKYISKDFVFNEHLKKTLVDYFQ